MWGEPGENWGRPKEPGENRGHLGREPGENRAFGMHLQRVPGEKRGLWDKNRGRTGGREFSLNVSNKRPNSGPENQRTGPPVKISSPGCDERL